MREKQNPPNVSLDAAGSGLGCHRHRNFLGLSLGRSFGNEHFPITALFDAGAYRACLGALFNDKRRATLRTRLRDGHVRAGEVTTRVSRAPIENTRAAAPGGAAATDEFAFFSLREFDRMRYWPRGIPL